jgi:aspartate-semialdehyde dehydrogenase
MSKLRVAVLGATGLVGQRFLQLLHGHPRFEVVAVTGSERSVGRRYGEVTRWILETPLPEEYSEMEVLSLDPSAIPKVDVVFSALPSDVAEKVEIELVRSGFTVVSNASNARLEEDVPLIVPEINLDHLRLLKVQRERRGWRGVLVKNPNCTTIILTMTLKPLVDEFGVNRLAVSTMQALSGAGIGPDGVLGMFITDNIIPYIRNEEEKVENESLKILGTLRGDHVERARLKIMATTTRVPVLEGHLESVFVELGKASLESIVGAFEGFRSVVQEWGLPTAPARPIVVRNELDRPQPRLDRMEGRGMSVVVGRVRDAGDGWFKYLALGHNTIRGAAGNTILIAEAMDRMELI